MLRERDIPQELRQTVAALIKNAAPSCQAKRRFYTIVNQNNQNLFAGVAYFETHPSCLPFAVALLHKELEEIRDELERERPKPA